MVSIRKKLAVIAGSVLVLGALFVPAPASAVSAVKFSATPGSGSYTVGSTITVNIYEDSGAADVDSVRADLSYSAGTLQLLSVTNAGSPFTTCVSNAGGGSGSLTTGNCTLLGGKKQGSQRIGQATFKVLSAGTGSITFSSSSQAVNGGLDLSESFDNASFTLAAAPASNPSTDGGSAPSNAGSGSTTSNNSTNTSTSTKKVATSNNTTSAAASDQTSTKSTTTGEVKDDATTKDDKKSDDDAKKNDEKKTSDNGSAWYEIIAMIIAASLAFLAGRRYRAHRLALKERMAQEAAAAAAAAKAKKASEKPAKKAADKPKKNSAKKKTKK